GLNLICLRELKNVGPSDAILDGFREAKQRAKHEKNVIIVRMDSDGDHNSEVISKLIAPIVAGKANAAVIDISYGLSNGFIDLVYNRIFGFIQGKVLSSGSFNQASPGFYAFRSIYLEKFIKFRTNYVDTYARHFKQKDRYGIDLSFLAFFHNSIVVIRHNAKPLQRGRRPLAKIYAQGKEMLKHFKIVKKLKNR
ncbi:MAG: glycosyltransferase, partial [Candidatus Micrarchaeota archaeon]|nr:glycosyltransferase [Candidatus Micrarchaeota archaeon]